MRDAYDGFADSTFKPVVSNAAMSFKGALIVKRFWLSLIATAILVISAAAQVETYQIDPAHSAAQFAVRHMGISTVRGAFSKLSGTVQYDPADPSKTAIDVTIDATSIDT